MLAKNTHGAPIEIRLDGVPGHPPKIIVLEPGEVGDFPDGYCQTVAGAGGRRIKPILERTWPGMKVLPASKQDRAKRAALAAAGGKTDDLPAVEVMMARFDQMAERMGQIEQGNAVHQQRAKEAESRATEAVADRDQLAAKVAELEAKLAAATPNAKEPTAAPAPAKAEKASK